MSGGTGIQEIVLQAAEDAYWADDDKLVNRKLQRKVVTLTLVLSLPANLCARLGGSI